MSTTPDTPGGAGPRRSSVLQDFIAARDAVGVSAESESDEAAEDQPMSVSLGLLALAVFLGVTIFIVGVLTASAVGALGALVGLGVAVAALVLVVRRVGTLGRLATEIVIGFVALVVGLMLGTLSYDERFFGDQASRPFWDAVSSVGFLLVVVGLLVALASILGVLALAVVRLFRRR